MNIPGNPSGRLQHVADLEEVERLYREIWPSIELFLLDQFALSKMAMEAVLNEAFTSLMCVGDEVPDVEGFLRSAARESAAQHVQLRGRLGTRNSDEDAVRFRRLLQTREALSRLGSNAREAVRLHFFENWSFEEIASELRVDVHAAERLVRKAVASLLGAAPQREPQE